MFEPFLSFICLERVASVALFLCSFIFFSEIFVDFVCFYEKRTIFEEVKRSNK